MRHLHPRSLLPLAAALLFPFHVLASATSPEAFPRTNAASMSTRDGQAVAAELQRRYDDLREDCGSPTAAPVECSGVLLRATAWKPGEHSWLAPGRPAGVSFSWLRQDANFTGAYAVNGFIVHPAQVAAALGYAPLVSRCVYYINAVTSGETVDRCRTQCDEWGVMTAEQFVERFPVQTYGCAFRAVARPLMEDRPAHAWMQMVGVRRIYAYGGIDEVIVAPYDDIGDAMPVEAFFYYVDSLGSGLDSAQKDQVDFRETTGRWVPVIRWMPAASIGERALFDYVEADQAILD